MANIFLVFFWRRCEFENAEKSNRTQINQSYIITTGIYAIIGFFW